MPPAAKHSYTYTTEFRDELEEQRLDLLRWRFLWYCGVMIGFAVIGLVIGLAVTWFGGRLSDDVGEAFSQPVMLFAWVITALSTLAYVLAFSWVYRNPQKKDQVFRIAFWLIVFSGVIALAQGPISAVIAKPNADGSISSGPVTVNTNDDGEPEDLTVGVTSKTLGLEPKQPDAVEPAVPAESAAPAESAPGAEPASASDPAAPQALPPPAEAAAQATAQDVGESDRDKAAAAKTAATGVSAAASAALVTGSGLWSVFVSHFFACCFLPWTPRESMRPIVPLLILNAVILLFYVRGSPWGIPIAIVLSPLVAAPGAGICWWRGSKIRDTFTLNVLKGRYSEIKRELVDARRIHESLFPGPFEAGGVSLDYRYEPMRQIGGDYLYARRIGPAEGAPPGRDYTHVVIVDVTGHGISAALTVNRLHGEIDRQLGERPDASPADLLTGLNNYLHHTLANHSVYATALCMRVDSSRDELTWASAGHPPAFLRAADGTVDQLDSTTMVLGACKGGDFDANQQTMRFAKGDSVIAYTDGAIEARNAAGRMLGVAGMRSMVASIARNGGSGDGRAGTGSSPAPGRSGSGLAGGGGFAGAGIVGGSALDPLIRAVDQHRFGPIQDDTLLVELSRPIRGA
ncbi:MAG: SpoIIE family protein phosphatase [Phycisphaerales bacterium]